MQNDSNKIMSPLPGAQPAQPTQPTQPIQPAQPTAQSAASTAQQPIVPATPITAHIDATATPSVVGITPTGSVSGASKSNLPLIKTIVFIIVSLIAVVFIGLFIWMFVRYDEASTNVQGQIDTAVAEAVADNTEELQNQFNEQEKYPYSNFSGPAEYGSLSFEYPKTWSVYIEEDSADGGDYIAYFNPVQVNPVDDDNINALRLSITSDNADDVLDDYNDEVEDGTLTASSRQIGGESISYFQGTLPDGDFVGRAVVFKLRDKTVVLQTDAETFAEEFDTLLGTVSFSQ